MSLRDSWNLKIPCHTLTMTQLRLSGKYVWHHENQLHMRLLIWPDRNVLNNSGCVLQPQWKMSVHFCFCSHVSEGDNLSLFFSSSLRHQAQDNPSPEKGGASRCWLNNMINAQVCLGQADSTIFNHPASSLAWWFKHPKNFCTALLTVLYMTYKGSCPDYILSEGESAHVLVRHGVVLKTDTN